MHRDKKEDCEITYTHGDTYLHEFSKRKSNEQVQTADADFCGKEKL
jgi:hypothetical protein